MTELKKSIHPKEGTTSFKSTCDMTFKLNEPKLLALAKKKNITNQIKQMKKTDNSTIQLPENEKKKKEPEMRQKLLEFYDNPFAYIDYLLEMYFQKKLSFHSDEEVKAKIKEDFEKIFKGINFKLNQFKNKQKLKLKELNDQIELRLRKKRNLIILKETDELSTEPLYNNENIEDIFIEQPQYKYTTIVSSIPSSKLTVLNDNQSKYYAPNINEQILSCLEKENTAELNPPHQRFIQSDDIRVNYMNRDELLEMKHLLDKDRALEQNEEKYQENITNHVKKTVEIQKKLLDDIITKSNIDFEKYDSVSQQYDELLQYMKTNLEKNQMFDKLSMSKLALFKYDINTIKKRLLQSDNEYDSIEKKKSMLQFEMNECNEIINDCLKKHRKSIKQSTIIDDNNDINTLYHKLKSKEKEDIENRIYYNDNPYHYNYNYIGSSIPISKTVAKPYNN